MKAIKCQPPKSPYHKRDFSVYAEPTAFDPLFMENVYDIADTMAEIMIICGIHRCKAKATQDIIVKTFQFYDLKRHRFHSLANDKKSIYRDDIVGDLERKCLMTRIEALLAYCIVKRALKAFYHGLPQPSIRNPVADAMLLKELEFAWLHAAKRTIVFFERYEHMFFKVQPNYSIHILKVYKELYKRLKSRADPIIIEDYHPRGCGKKMVIGSRSLGNGEKKTSMCVKKCKTSQNLREYREHLPTKIINIKSCPTLLTSSDLLYQSQPETAELNKKSPQSQKNCNRRISLGKNRNANLTRCPQCHCPQIICDCHIDHDTGLLAIDSSQGPYKCQWVHMDEDDDEPDPCIEKAELHHCPVDCWTSESSCDSNFTESSECSAESDINNF